MDFRFEQRVSGVKDAVNRRRRYCAVLPIARPQTGPYGSFPTSPRGNVTLVKLSRRALPADVPAQTSHPPYPQMRVCSRLVLARQRTTWYDSIGTNLGGLGTLIASMASLISYKRIAKEAEDRKGRYIALFTVGDLCFLAALIALNALLVR